MKTMRNIWNKYIVPAINITVCLVCVALVLALLFTLVTGAAWVIREWLEAMIYIFE